MTGLGKLTYLPDHACIGFPKCATSFIQNHVFKDAGLGTLGRQEHSVQALSDYQERIRAAQAKGNKVGVKSPVIIYSRPSVDQFLKSGCKIIICIRYPVQWIKSFYNFRLKQMDIWSAN